jgi:hypothetical protein
MFMLWTTRTELCTRLNDRSDFPLDSLEFRRLGPQFNPVHAMVVSADITDSCVEEEFGDVGCGGTVGASDGKVFYHVLAIVAEGTKVVAMSAGGKRKDAVELFD